LQQTHISCWAIWCNNDDSTLQPLCARWSVDPLNHLMS
jgi:hypothetical protein